MNKTAIGLKDKELAQGQDEFGMTPEDWAALDKMTDDEITAAALADPDAQPTSPERLARMRRVAPAKFIRQKLGMSQERFAAAYAIPLDLLASWERHACDPSPVELAYLRAIERAPDATRVPEPV